MCENFMKGLVQMFVRSPLSGGFGVPHNPLLPFYVWQAVY